VLGVLAQDVGEVAGSGDKEPVEAYPAQAADPAFGDRVRSRRLGGRPDDADVGGFEHGIEGAAELGVAVPDDSGTA
jgi:hypothetical protein